MAALQANQLYEAFQGERIEGINDLHDAIQYLDERRGQGNGGSFVWRGSGNANHAFNSSLFRRLWWTMARRKDQSLDETPPPTEGDLREAEDRVLADTHRWGLHDADRGRLSVLRQLAMLQHNHAPTRLIDVSLNPYIAAWFAVEPRYDDDGSRAADSTDGRIFAIGTANRLINESGDRDWEDDLHRPWRSEKTNNGGQRWQPPDWCQNTRVWIPAPADRRIAAQQGAFLLGGVPSAKQFPKSTGQNAWLSAEEARRVTSVPLRFHKVGAASGSALSPAYTWPIAAASKDELRQYLKRRFGYGTSRVYPDFPGFATFGTRWLSARAPE